MIKTSSSCVIFLALLILNMETDPSLASSLLVHSLTTDEHNVDLSSFGVTCNGNTDISSTLNEAIASIRSRSDSPYSPAFRLSLPKGDCVVRSSLNLTNLRSKSILIEGSGTKLLGKTTGKPVIDALGSEFLRIRDLTVIGDKTERPSIGIQIGRSEQTSVQSADNINLDSVAISGYFSFAALYNLNSETSLFTHLIAVNEDEGYSYTVVQDGLNHFNGASEFTDVHLPVDTPQSFNENIFINCDIRHNSRGVPLFLAQTSRHMFLRSYVASVHGKVGVVLFSMSAGDGNVQPEFDVHFETNSLETIFQLSGENRNPIVKGLRYIDQYPGSSKSIFSGINLTSAQLQNVRIELADLPKTTKIFNDPSIWSATGDIYVGRSSAWNLDEARFSGVLNKEGEVSFFGRFFPKK